ncbi:MAG TPA: toxin HicA [Spirochaetia bacterium]|nr:MAG: toxin HicA [Spirochaetes bacterium GWB1_36_13]HCL57453.1 toxin HicA [Spirochaetia bacterium]
MSKLEKFLVKILSGNADQNIDFHELCHLLQHLGFSLRIKGSHHIFTKENIDEIINIQPESKNAKAYQVKQIRKIIIDYKLGGSL